MPRGDNLSVGISQKNGKKSAASREKRVRRLQLLSELGTQAKKEKLQEPNIDAIPSTSGQPGQFYRMYLLNFKPAMRKFRYGKSTRSFA